jgi:hypothetical protein
MRKLSLTLAAVVLLGILPATGAAGTCGRRAGAWRQIQAPRFPDGEIQRIEELHVHDARPRTVLVSNGDTLLLSTDGGCRFEEIYRLPAEPTETSPFSRNASKITTIASPEGDSGRLHVIVRVGDTSDPLYPSGIFLLNSSDLGATWAPTTTRFTGGALVADAADGGTGSQQLPSEELTISPSDPDVMYLGYDSAVLAPTQLFRSEDGGNTWTPVSLPIDPASSTVFAYGPPRIVVHPRDPETVFLSLVGPLFTSTDAGETWSITPKTEELNLYGMHLDAPEGRPWKITGFDQRYVNSEVRSVVSIEGDGQVERANALGLTGGFQSATLSRGGLLVTTYDYGHDYSLGAFLLDPRRSRAGRFTNIDSGRLSPLYDAQTGAGGSDVYFRTAAAIVTYRGR